MKKSIPHTGFEPASEGYGRCPHGSWAHAMTSNDLKNQVMIDLGPEGPWLTLSQSSGQTDSNWLRYHVAN